MCYFITFFFSLSTETSADLQKILQEIQPRDSNDFFTSARELDPSETGHNSEQKEPENEVHRQQICNTGTNTFAHHYMQLIYLIALMPITIVSVLKKLKFHRFRDLLIF